MSEEILSKIYIYVQDEDKSYDVSASPIIRDYVNTGILPDVDSLLDWRFKLKTLQGEGLYPKEWFDTEIFATDYLLQKH